MLSPYLPKLDYCCHYVVCNSWLVHGSNALAHWPIHTFDLLLHLPNSSRYYLHRAADCLYQWLKCAVFDECTRSERKCENQLLALNLIRKFHCISIFHVHVHMLQCIPRNTHTYAMKKSFIARKLLPRWWKTIQEVSNLWRKRKKCMCSSMLHDDGS